MRVVGGAEKVGVCLQDQDANATVEALAGEEEILRDFTNKRERRSGILAAHLKCISHSASTAHIGAINGDLLVVVVS